MSPLPRAVEPATVYASWQDAVDALRHDLTDIACKLDVVANTTAQSAETQRRMMLGGGVLAAMVVGSVLVGLAMFTGQGAAVVATVTAFPLGMGALIVVLSGVRFSARAPGVEVSSGPQSK